MKQIYYLLIALMLLVSPAAALEKVQLDDTYYFNVESPSNYYISGINVGDLEPDSTTQIVFDNYGKIYTLDVVSEKSSIGWWEITLTLDGPNGTESKTLDTFQPFANDFDLRIQPYWWQLDSVLDVDVYVGLLPLNAQLIELASAQSDYGEMLPEDALYTVLAFTQVIGSTSSPADVTVYLSDEEEFKAQQEQSLLAQLKQAGEDIFIWTWEGVLAFLEQIPRVGPHLVSSIEIVAILAGGAIFYFDLLFIQYPVTTFLTIEFFILSSSIIKTKRTANITRMIDQTVEAHIDVIVFFVNVFSTVLNLLINIVSTIAQIVRSLKPI